MGTTISRSEAREAAFCVVFSGDCQDIQTLELALNGRKCGEREQGFIDKILCTVKNKGTEIDEKIKTNLVDFSIDRIKKTDLAALRVAIAEFIINEVIKSVVINEAVIIAKKYGDKDSGQFVNGILAKIAERS
jgi:N utilization substance protein B